MGEARGFSDRGKYFRRGQEFVKEYVDGVDIEYQKAKEVYGISRRSGRFLAPRPKELVPGKSQIVYEFIDVPVRSVRELYLATLRGGQAVGTAAPVFRRIGESLALLHRDLSLASRSDWRSDLSEQLVDHNLLPSLREPSRGSEAVLHGDFGFSNILVPTNISSTRELPSMWLIDASPNYFMTFSADAVGPVEVDLANLAACMHGLFPLRRQFFLRWEYCDRLLEEVLIGYQELSDYVPDRDLLQQFVRLTLAQYLRQRVSSDQARNLAMGLLSRRIAKSQIYREKK